MHRQEGVPEAGAIMLKKMSLAWLGGIVLTVSVAACTAVAQPTPTPQIVVTESVEEERPLSTPTTTSQLSATTALTPSHTPIITVSPTQILPPTLPPLPTPTPLPKLVWSSQADHLITIQQIDASSVT